MCQDDEPANNFELQTRSLIVNFDELMSLRIIMNYELQPPLGFAES